MFISKRAKVMSDKPQYTKKIKTPSGYKWVYSPKFISKRWKEKKNKLKLLDKNILKLKKQLDSDIKSDDLRIRAIAAVVLIIMATSMRVGNKESAKEAKTFGATTLKVKHVKLRGSKARFEFEGKKHVHQIQEISNANVVSVLRELMKGKKPNDPVFEVDGGPILDRAINRYLESYKISAKDLRGFNANALMKQHLKTQDFDTALKEVAEEIGHEEKTLKNDYLDPDLVAKHEDKIKKKADVMEDLYSYLEKLQKQQGSVLPRNVKPDAKVNTLILNAWKILSPFLPSGAKLTSGIRTEKEQLDLIYRYWKDFGAFKKYPEVVDPEQMARLLSEMGVIIMAPGKSNHQKGNAFDISGANLNEIADVVRFVNNNPELGAKFGPPVIEPKTNSVHVNIYSAVYKPEEIARFMEEDKVIASVVEEDHTDYDALYQDFLASNPPEELVKEVSDFFSKQASAIFKEFPKTCNCCGKTYDTEEDFITRPFRGDIRDTIELNDPGWMCGGPDKFDLLHRDCECGSTLVVKYRCPHTK